MAPEVLRSLPYNERVDVFSFGIILYELFARRLVGSDLMNMTEWDESVGFAEKVAAGWRPTFPQHMPEDVRRLVDCCWSGTPELRPSMSDVLLRLKALQREGVLGATKKKNNGTASKSAGKMAQAPTNQGANACCSVM
jgi:serine/threonine protein kinase